MKDQTTTIEQSCRLLELGVPAEKASCHWDRMAYSIQDEKHLNGRRIVWDDWCLEIGIAARKKMEYRENIPAFTVADLLEVMPETLYADMQLTLIKENGEWIFEYADNENPCHGAARMKDLITLLCDRIEWLLSNGYKLEV